MQWVTTTIFLEQLDDDSGVAWEALAAQFRAAIISFAGRLGLPVDESEDVAQETLAAFANGYRKGQYERGKGRLSSWLFGIADRQIRNRSRKLAREREHSVEQTSFWTQLPDTDFTRATWDQSWEAMVLDRCLLRVRQEFQPNTIAAFERVTLGEETAEDVAKDLDLTRNAVFVARHRVLKRLRALQSEFEERA